MKITSGKLKGFKIKVPPGNRVRPAKDIVRQAVFNIIAEHIADARVLDLFAGSGSYGLEALSRGAAWVDFVDKDKECTKVIKDNLLHTNFENQAKVYTMKVKRFIDDLNTSLTRADYDFVFLSPPYREGIDMELLEKLPKVLKSRGLIIFEHSKHTKLFTPRSLKLLDQRTYGAATVSFLQKVS